MDRIRSIKKKDYHLLGTYVSNMGKEWINVKLPKAQRDAVNKLLDELPELGYPSFGSFVRDSVRMRYTELKKMLDKESQKLLD